jgi:hypothetical protein
MAELGQRKRGAFVQGDGGPGDQAPVCMVPSPGGGADSPTVHDDTIADKGETFSGSSVSDGEVPVRPPPDTPESGEFRNKGTIRRFSCPIRALIPFPYAGEKNPG